MKKYTAFCLLILLTFALCLSACGSENVQPSGNSSSEESSEPLEDSSVNEPLDESDVSEPSKDPSEEVSDDRSGEMSDEQSSMPDSSVSEDQSAEPPEAAGDISVNELGEAAVSSMVRYTKVDPTAAIECATNAKSGITAVYDGAVTRFFDATVITYYHALPGRYLVACCDGFTTENGGSYISFTRNGETVSFVSESGHNHEITANNYYYISDYGMAVCPVEGDGNYFRRFTDNSLVPCRALDYSMITSWDSVPAETLGKYGVVKDGEVVIPFEYDYISTLQSAGEKGVFRALKDGVTYYLSSNGAILTPEGFTCGSEPFGNSAWVFNGDQGYIINFN